MGRSVVQNRAMCFFLGVCRYTQTAAVAGYMGWLPSIVRQRKSISILWSRFSVTSDECINKRVHKYAINKGSARLKNWPYRIINHFDNINCSEYSNMAIRISNFNMNSQVSIKFYMIDSYKLQWIRLVTTNQELHRCVQKRDGMRACASPRGSVYSVEIVPKTNSMYCLEARFIKYFSEMPVHMTSLLIPMLNPLNSHFCSSVPV